MLAVVVAAIGVVVLATAWNLRRRHRRTPYGWQTGQSQAALLHRRLHRCVDQTRRAVADVGTRGVPLEQLVALTEDLDAAALAVDRQLVVAARLPDGARHRALLDLKWRIVAVEKLSAKVRSLGVDFVSPRPEDADRAIRRVNERLDALEAARVEARDIGRTSAGEA